MGAGQGNCCAVLVRASASTGAPLHHQRRLDGERIVEEAGTGAMLRKYIRVDDIPLAVFA
jgi:hypothetical protein